MKSELRIVSFHLRMLWHFVFVFSFGLLSPSLYLYMCFYFSRRFFFFFSSSSFFYSIFPFALQAFVCCEHHRRRSRSLRRRVDRRWHRHFMIALRGKLLRYNIYLILFQSLFYYLYVFASILIVGYECENWSNAESLGRHFDGRENSNQFNWFTYNSQTHTLARAQM